MFFFPSLTLTPLPALLLFSSSPCSSSCLPPLHHLSVPFRLQAKAVYLFRQDLFFPSHFSSFPPFYLSHCHRLPLSTLLTSLWRITVREKIKGVRCVGKERRNYVADCKVGKKIFKKKKRCKEEFTLYILCLLNHTAELSCVMGETYAQTHRGLRLHYGPGCHAHSSITFENRAIKKYSTKIQPEGMISVCVCLCV